MISFVSNGDLVVQQKNCEACQYLEFFAMSVKQYCKETKDRDKRLYDTRGIVISTMANDLKDFVKGYLDRNGKRKNYENNVSSSMLVNIVEALEIFGEVYNSGSCKKWADALRNSYKEVFMYNTVVSKVISALKENSFIVTRSNSTCTSSVYLDIDYKILPRIRISDHYKEGFEGIQLIMGKDKIPEAGSNCVYYLRIDAMEHDLEKVIHYVIKTLKYNKNKLANLRYLESLRERKTSYKEENANFQGIK